jgi:hypothetical protein
MKTKKFCSLFANQMIEIRTCEQTNRSVSGFGPICKPIISSEQNYMGGGSAGNHTIIGVLSSDVVRRSRTGRLGTQFKFC